jgi:aminopeptidase N
MGKDVTRLFKQFQPSHYDLSLAPDKQSMTFSGTVTIHGRKVGRPSQRITLHGKGLKITAATIIKHDKKGDTPVELSRTNLQKSQDEIRLHGAQMIYPGEYTITLRFSGTIVRGLTGIYPCFFEHEGSEHSLLMTQFESHHAREAFPCIDEPEAKATFNLSLIAPKNEVALSNTPQAAREPLNAWPDWVHEATARKSAAKDATLATFEPTPRMSTYLLAFVIGELQNIATKTQRGTDVSVWATVAQPAKSMDFALDIARASIEFFEDYFGVDYPLAKADHVAVPDFSAGAMENWGLITYRERALLVYPGETAQSSQEYIATVIAHETSHQWFGNLVTMKWWDDLWLNESFANLMEYQAVDSMHPEWHVWDTFIAQEGLSAFRRDAIPGVQAVRTALHHPDEISTLFDPSIVYAKGGRTLYMLKSYLGDDVFRKGLSAYFTKHAYGNTTGDDLWAALGEASGKDVGAFMNPWLNQSGFPLVHITQDNKTVELRQEHFLDDPKKADADRLWPLPLFTETPGQPDMFSTRDCKLQVPSDKTVLINTGARGHYITHYVNDTQKQDIVEMISSHNLGEADRLMLLNGSSMLARAGYESYDSTLAMLEAYQNEDTEPVWDMISLIVAETRRFIDYDETLEDAIKALIRHITKQQYARLGWKESDDESSADQKLRGIIIGLGAYAEEPEIIKQSLALFDAYQISPGKVPAELRGIVFTVPIKQQIPDAFDYLVKLHDQTANSDLKSEVAAALTATRSEKDARLLLERIKDAKIVKPQDADRWLIYLLRNRYVRNVAWDWMIDNWSWIEETYRHDKSYDMLPRYAASMVNTKPWADKYQAFFGPKESQVVLKRNIQIGLAEIEARVAWLERDIAGVKSFFSKR